MIPAFLLLMSYNFSNLVPDIDIQKILNSTTTASNMEIAADSSFAQKTRKFNAGQTIFVRVSTDNSGQDKHILNLRDNNYNLITGYSMAGTGNQFLVNFPAPNTAGIYSLEANITSSGSVSNFVQTIEVEGESSSNNSSVNVKINNQVNTGNQVSIGPSSGQAGPGQSEDDQPSSSPETVLGDQSSQPPETQGFFTSIWQTVLNFFKGIF